MTQLSLILFVKHPTIRLTPRDLAVWTVEGAFREKNGRDPKVSQVADFLGVSVATVKRARQVLRKVGLE